MTKPEDATALHAGPPRGVAEFVAPRGLPGYSLGLLLFSAVLVSWSTFHLIVER